MQGQTDSQLTPRVLEALYTEAMVLADEARSYFESGRFRDETNERDSDLGVLMSCESLKVTTRLMHCVAWLVNQRALHSGELTPGERWQADRLLGTPAPPDMRIVDHFPEEARTLTLASEELFHRLKRLEAQMLADRDMREPMVAVRGLHERLAAAF